MAKKYEYKIFRRRLVGLKSIEETDERITEWLNELGQEGWVVTRTVIPRSDANFNSEIILLVTREID